MPSTERFSEVLRDWAQVFMHRSARDFKRFMDESGLSVSQLNTMMRLYHKGECGLSEISGHLGISNAATSQAVDRLVQMGLLGRREDPQDRRVKQLELTDQGRTLIEKVFDSRRQWMEGLTDTLTPDQQETIIDALTLLTRAAHNTED